MTWKNRFLKEEPKNVELPTEFKEILDGFVEYINEVYSNSIKIEAFPSQVPTSKLITFCAYLIPASRTTLLVLSQSEGRLKGLPGHNSLSDSEWIDIHSPENFFDLLKTLSSTNYFKTQAKVMNELNGAKEFNGGIYTNDFYESTKMDFNFTISKSEVEKISGAKDQVTVEVNPTEPSNPFIGVFQKDRIEKYKYFEVNGFQASILDDREMLNDGKLKISLEKLNS